MVSNTNFFENEQLIVSLARTIAMDHYELDEVLQHHGITHQQWMHIKEDRYFNNVLQSEIAAWNQVSNTHERSKLKAASVIENWLPEAHNMLHARGESLAARVGLAQLLAKIAGMGVQSAEVEVGGGGERFVININLGDRELKLEKVINAEVDNSELGVIEEEVAPRAIPTKMEKYAMSGGGVKQVNELDRALNPSMLVKKWSV